MLLFSTVLSINDTLSKDDFICLAIEWNKVVLMRKMLFPGWFGTGKGIFDMGAILCGLL